MNELEDDADVGVHLIYNVLLFTKRLVFDKPEAHGLTSSRTGHFVVRCKNTCRNSSSTISGKWFKNSNVIVSTDESTMPDPTSTKYFKVKNARYHTQ